VMYCHAAMPVAVTVLLGFIVYILANIVEQPACRHRVKSVFGPNKQLNVLFEQRA